MTFDGSSEAAQECVREGEKMMGSIILKGQANDKK